MPLCCSTFKFNQIDSGRSAYQKRFNEFVSAHYLFCSPTLFCFFCPKKIKATRHRHTIRSKKTHTKEHVFFCRSHDTAWKAHRLFAPVSFYILLHLPGQCHQYDPLLAILACTATVTVCGHTGLHAAMLHLRQQAHRCDPRLALLACTDGGTACDRTKLHVQLLLYLPEQGRRCDPLLALLACTDGGTVCGRLRIHVPLLHLRQQAESSRSKTFVGRDLR